MKNATFAKSTSRFIYVLMILGLMKMLSANISHYSLINHDTGILKLDLETTFDPDSTYEDSLAVADDYGDGDTISFSNIGLDTVFTLYEDSLSDPTDTIYDSTETELREFDFTRDISITPGGFKKEIQQELFGYHLEGMFTPKHQPQDESNVNYPTTWGWLADLKPRVLRFPGGGSSRWMHLLPYDTDGDNIDDKFPIGYGYDLEEIIRYYDITNETDDPGNLIDNIQADDPLYMAGITSDLADDICDNCHEWMNSDDYKGSIENAAENYHEQMNVLPTLSQQQLYIDQFIALVDYIQDQGNYTVDVIIDLNVISETASQCRRIIDYLENDDSKEDGGNGVTSVHVVGVEMGNEMNLKWAQDLMGYNQFDDYWGFINGHDFDEVDADAIDDPGELFSEGYQSWVNDYFNYVFNPAFQSDHNFISSFKSDPSFLCKVGLPAANLKSGAPEWYALRTEADLSSNWNLDMTNHYYDFITVDGIDRFLFDAVILHPYYEPNGNYNQIPVDYFCDEEYPVSGTAPDCTSEACDFWPADKWQYNTEDERLSDAFERLMGLSGNDFGNFKTFIRQRYDQSYDKQNTDLKLYLKKKWKKELWTTEWNLKDKNNDYSNDSYEQTRLTSYCNSFAHGLLIHEWFLNDLKKNFDPDYREGFHTYSTFHGWGGGAYYAMTLHADAADLSYHLDEAGNPDPLDPAPAGQLLWLKRTMYYTFELLSEISKRELQYVPSNYLIYAHNPNIQPTLFIDAENTLYIYYSNMKNETQSYKLTPGYLINLFPGATTLGFGDAEIFNVDPLRSYSCSGRSMLFDMNTCYNNTNHLHPFEIQGVTGPVANDPECTGLPGGAICVTVPPNSYGYFTVPVYTSPREGIVLTEKQINIYPNPSGNSFRINCTLPQVIIDEFVIDIFNLQGEKTGSLVTRQNEPIDISGLPSGMFMVGITDAKKSFYIYKKMMKIE